MDEKDRIILEMRNKGRKAVHQSIYDEYTMIGDTRYLFDWCTVVQPRIHIMLPKEFIDLPLEIAKLRYPSEDRPKEIKSSLDSLVNIAFLYGQPLKDESDVILASRIYAAAIRQINPSNEFKESNTMYRDKKEKRLVSWYEYLSPAFGERVYNRHAFLGIEGKLLQIVFNCPEGRAEQWKGVLPDIMASTYSDLERQF